MEKKTQRKEQCMGRLTIRNSDGSVSQPTNLKWTEALEKLADYEDAEEKRQLWKEEKNATTNREWLNSLSDEDFAKFVFDKEEVKLGDDMKEAIIVQPCPRLHTITKKFVSKWDSGKEKFLSWLKEKRM